MRCPYCGGLNTQVKDSRPSEDSNAIRRRRHCPDCEGRFTTFERVQLRELTVVKRDGSRVPFNRDKLVRSIQVAIRKRPIDPEWVERMVSDLIRRFETSGDAEVSSEDIGLAVMHALKDRDAVAFIRFASVYRDFTDAKDFEDIIADIAPSAAPVR